MAADTDVKIQNSIIYSVFVRNHTGEGTFRALIPDLPRITRRPDFAVSYCITSAPVREDMKSVESMYPAVSCNPPASVRSTPWDTGSCTFFTPALCILLCSRQLCPSSQGRGACSRHIPGFPGSS